MLRFFCFIFLLFSFGYAKNLEATYKVSFGIFGEVGMAKASLHVKEDRTYEISMYAYTTGFSAFLSGNRQEWFHSSGEVDANGLLVPHVYKKIVQREKNSVTLEKREFFTQRDIKTYTFSHATKKILLVKQKEINSKLVSQSQEELSYFSENDLLSLFFNFKMLLKSLHVQDFSLYAVGANKKDGRIDIQKLTEHEKIKKEFSWEDGEYLKVTINDKIFASKKGELLVNLREDGIVKSAVLKDVILFGDIRGELVD
jgi:hypothetical protein